MATSSIDDKDKKIFYLAVIYFFIVLFGTAFRIGGGENWYGLSTLVILAIIFLKLPALPGGFRENSLLLTILALFLWCLFTGYFSSTSVALAYSSLGTFFGYLFAATAIYKSSFTMGRMQVLFVTLAVSMLLSCMLTIVDFLNIYNVPFVNEFTKDTKIGGERLEQVGGFFTKRTSMAAYFSLVIPALIYLTLRSKNMAERLLFSAAATAGFLTLMLTHNRSGVLGIVLALFIFLVRDKSLRIGKKIKVFMYASISFALVLVAVSILFPSTMEVYVAKLAAYIPGMTQPDKLSNYAQSDYSRIYFFNVVLESLGSNPIGNGFSKIYSEQYGVSSPHNVISQLIWAAGLLAFAWIPIFAIQVRKNFSTRVLLNAGNNCSSELVYIAALQVALLSWLLNNMAHTSLTTGLGWMFLGLMLGLIRDCKATPFEREGFSGTTDSIRETRRQTRILRPKSSG